MARVGGQWISKALARGLCVGGSSLSWRQWLATWPWGLQVEIRRRGAVSWVRGIVGLTAQFGAWGSAA